MIPHTTLQLETLSWQDQLAQAIRDPVVLFNLLELDHRDLVAALSAQKDFNLVVPRRYLAKIRKGDLLDPLLAQVLPVGAELVSAPGFTADPLKEMDASPAPGLIHKYPGRVLLIVSPMCAVHCRYCFRRHFPYKEDQPARQKWRNALRYIATNKNISEVIFSGGDPLAVNDRHLEWLVDQIARIGHVKRLRVHTRFPVVIPARITDQCINWLTKSRLKPIMVLHANHPNELDLDTEQAVSRLKMAGVDVLNQSVLLKGVNDNAETLVNLSEKLYSVGVLPYYLHVLDAVQGAAHFAVDYHEIPALQRELSAHLPGYLVPKLVFEKPGATAKLPVQFTADLPR
jgi:L-lysine 2,3-aminomutase